MARARLVLLAACLALPGLLPAACSSRPQVRPEPEPILLPDRAPADFTLAVTVLAPEREPAETPPRSQRPARYIVEPSGALRAATGEGATPRVYPGITRQLTEPQWQRLWRLTADTGLLEPGSLARIDNTEIFFPSRDRATALIYIRQQGEEAHFAVRLPVGDASSAAVARLIDEVAALAWIPE